jgi:hypothetical protein
VRVVSAPATAEAAARGWRLSPPSAQAWRPTSPRGAKVDDPVVCARDFYRGYKNCRLVLPSPTQSFIIAIDLPQCAHPYALALLLHLAFDDLSHFPKVMAHCSPLGEVAVANVAEAENLDVVDNPVEVAQMIGGELFRASDGEGPALSVGGVEASTGASDDESCQTYYFGPTTITRGKIKEMVEKGYFTEGEAREPVAEAIPEPDDGKVVIYEDFFVAGLCLPLHPALGEILQHF